MNKLIFTVELDGSDLYKVNNNNADAFERKADRLLMTPAFYSIVRDALKASLEDFNNPDDTNVPEEAKKPCTCKSMGNNSKSVNNNKGCKQLSSTKKTCNNRAKTTTKQ